MSVGHIARLMETAGIPTVIIAAAAFRSRLTVMNPPRVLLTPHLMGRPLGFPHDHQNQRHILQAALRLLVDAPAGNHLVDYAEMQQV
ncbi:MAG: hypothetical protein GY943_10115 [Chloroflexi bacterium]|nr:hypothetical protein [Chloroflexota bacterium]